MEFQHVACTTSRVKDSLLLTFYGRMADGRSIAAHVHRIPHYGFIQAPSWPKDVQTYLKAWSCYQKCKRYGFGDANPQDDRELEKAFWNSVKRIPLATYRTSGFNIRNVEEGATKTFIRFETRSPNTWRAILHVLQDSHKARQEMIAWANQEDFLLELPPAYDRYMLYETFFKPESVYMVDHQLTSCGWMRAEGPTTTSRTTCDVEIDVRTIRGIEPPQDLAPLRVLSYDIEAQPHVYADGREPGFPQPSEDPILTIGVTWFDLLDNTPRQAVFQLEPSGVPPLRELAPLSDPTDDFDPSTTQVFSFTNEKFLLQGFAEYVT